MSAAHDCYVNFNELFKAFKLIENDWDRSKLNKLYDVAKREFAYSLALLAKLKLPEYLYRRILRDSEFVGFVASRLVLHNHISKSLKNKAFRILESSPGYSYYLVIDEIADAVNRLNPEDFEKLIKSGLKFNTFKREDFDGFYHLLTDKAKMALELAWMGFPIKKIYKAVWGNKGQLQKPHKKREGRRNEKCNKRNI